MEPCEEKLLQEGVLVDILYMSPQFHHHHWRSQGVEVAKAEVGTEASVYSIPIRGLIVSFRTENYWIVIRY